MVIVIGSTKGGSGKTTLATNLVAIDVGRGNDVLLVDTDKQGSASNWGAVREEANVPRVSIMQKFGGLSLTRELQALSNKYKRVYVDAGGYDSESLRSSLLVASKILIPLRPSQLDVWDLPRIVEIVSQSQIYNPSLQVYFVMNGLHTNPSVKQKDDVLALAEEIEGMIFAESVLHNRLAFSKASGLGLSVTELTGRDRDVKAVGEIISLYKEVICGEA